jgi:hypothetical protein
VPPRGRAEVERAAEPADVHEDIAVMLPGASTRTLGVRGHEASVSEFVGGL